MAKNWTLPGVCFGWYVLALSLRKHIFLKTKKADQQHCENWWRESGSEFHKASQMCERGEWRKYVWDFINQSLKQSPLGFGTISSVFWPNGEEGTGTLPDYLVNRADKKIEGPYIHWIWEIVVEWTVGVVEAHGQLNQGENLRNPRTKYDRSKNVCSVTSIALSLGHIRARLLELTAQSLIGSLGTLMGRIFLKSFSPGVHPCARIPPRID